MHKALGTTVETKGDRGIGKMKTVRLRSLLGFLDPG